MHSKDLKWNIKHDVYYLIDSKTKQIKYSIDKKTLKNINITDFTINSQANLEHRLKLLMEIYLDGLIINDSNDTALWTDEKLTKSETLYHKKMNYMMKRGHHTSSISTAPRLQRRIEKEKEKKKHKQRLSTKKSVIEMMNGETK
mgnify:CR=1 FL=1